MYNGAYYRDKLSGRKLLKCYEMAPSRIKQYLEAEIRFVISRTRPSYHVLELGCGYGRVMRRIAPFASWVVGNDTSKVNLELARSYLEGLGNCSVCLMDASQMALDPFAFDAVFCIQNGISAFGVDQKRLIAESVRATKPNGLILFSSYSPKIWAARLEWFRTQSESGLIGEIDEDETGDGTIVCRDGFKASTLGASQLIELFAEHGLKASIIEVDESSIFSYALKTGTAKRTNRVRFS